jgi:hypothetical protein
VEQDRETQTKLPDDDLSSSDYENCNQDAFRAAALTLESRAKSWRGNSPDLADWLKGQDAVFANCSAKTLVLPANAPAGSSPLLKADRAYQIAAAEFYAGKFDEARAAFEAIGQDGSSPWRGLGRYLAARCLVRQAFLQHHDQSDAGDSMMAGFDVAPMQHAAALLESLLQEPQPGMSRQAIQNELDLVQIRIEPMAQLRMLATALTGPGTDPDYAQHLQDLAWYLNAKLDSIPVREDADQFPSLDGQSLSSAAKAQAFEQTYRDLAPLRASSTLLDWLVTFQSPADAARQHAIAEWKTTRQLWWLVAAISKATEQDPEAAELVTVAQQVPANAPAWESVTYHRARLLVGLGQADEARRLLDAVLPALRASGRDSSVNLYLGLRMRASENLNDALSYAPRKLLLHTSEEQDSLDECLYVMKNPKRVYDCKQPMSPIQLSLDATSVFNTQTPLDTLTEIANGGVLPEQLRRAVAIMAWTRSVLLKNDQAAAKLFPLLPEKLQQQIGGGTGFSALMAILRNPGLRPYLDAGVQRSYSYDFVESYADNWWCHDWQPNEFANDTSPFEKERVAFLTSAQQRAGEREMLAIQRQGSAEVDLGGLTLAYAQAHPDDTKVPEALYLVLRLIRYGCNHSADAPATEAEQQKILAIQSGAARLLRQRYAANPWTKKAAPFARLQ